MKRLNEYLNQSSDNVIFEYINYEMTLEDVYEQLFYKMFDVNNNYQLNEGLGNWLRNLASKADKVDQKAEELKNAAKEKINKLSDSAKIAIERAKKEAGDAWDSVKDTYTSTVATIDDALQNAKTSVENVLKNAGIKTSEYISVAGQVMTNLYAQGKEKLANSFKDTKMVAAMNALLVGAILCKKSGIDSTAILDILTAAGIK